MKAIPLDQARYTMKRAAEKSATAEAVPCGLEAKTAAMEGLELAALDLAAALVFDRASRETSLCLSQGSARDNTVDAVTIRALLDLRSDIKNG